MGRIARSGKDPGRKIMMSCSILGMRVRYGAKVSDDETLVFTYYTYSFNYKHTTEYCKCFVKQKSLAFIMHIFSNLSATIPTCALESGPSTQMDRMTCLVRLEIFGKGGLVLFMDLLWI